MNAFIPQQMDDPVEDRLLRAADVQAQLGMSRAKVYRLMQNNILPTVRIGGSVRVPRKALFRWIEENTLPGRACPPTDSPLTTAGRIAPGGLA